MAYLLFWVSLFLWQFIHIPDISNLMGSPLDFMLDLIASWIAIFRYSKSAMCCQASLDFLWIKYRKHYDPVTHAFFIPAKYHHRTIPKLSTNLNSNLFCVSLRLQMLSMLKRASEWPRLDVINLSLDNFLGLPSVSIMSAQRQYSLPKVLNGFTLWYPKGVRFWWVTSCWYLIYSQYNFNFPVKS